MGKQIEKHHIVAELTNLFALTWEKFQEDVEVFQKKFYIFDDVTNECLKDIPNYAESQKIILAPEMRIKLRSNFVMFLETLKEFDKTVDASKEIYTILNDIIEEIEEVNVYLEDLFERMDEFKTDNKRLISEIERACITI